MKKNKLLKKACIYMLVGVIASSSVFMSYDNAKTVKAVAVVDDIAILLALCAAMGVTYEGIVKIVADADLPPTATIDDYGSVYDEAEQGSKEYYDNFLKGLGVSYDPDTPDYNPDPDGDGEPDGPEDPKDPKSWKDFLAQKLASATTKKLVLGGITTAALGRAGYQAWLDKQNTTLPADSPDYEQMMMDYNGKTFPYHIYRYRWDGSIDSIYCSKYPFYVYPCNASGSDIISVKNGEPYPTVVCYSFQPSGVIYSYSVVGDGAGNVLNGQFKGDIAKYFNSKAEFEEFIKNNPNYVPTTDEYGISDALDKYFQEHPNEKTAPVPDSVQIPSRDDILQFMKDLNEAQTPDDKQDVIDNFYNEITNPSVDPSEPIDPSNPENPDPDKPTDPSNPENPSKPDISPENPDKMDTANQGGKITADLKTLFPFCIPFDLIAALSLLRASPEAPRIVIPIKISALNIDEQIVFDFSEFPYVGEISRVMFTLLFILGLILATRALIKG